MPRRSGEVKCPICFEPLLNSLDDLDEPLPAVVTECGHGFHKTCIEQWFKSQAEAYVAMMEPRQSDFDDPITTADAPALCPSCREECFADADTGQVNLIRLFFATEDGNDGSSQMAGSSPIRPMHKTDKAASVELMGLARRAKGITADFATFDYETGRKHVDGALNRAEEMTKDVASAKAVQAVKRYIGGLTTAINTFRSQLQESPLPAMLRAELEIAKSATEAAKHETRLLRTRELEPHVQQLASTTRSLDKMTKGYKRLKVDFDETRKELEEVRTTSAAQMKNLKESFVLMKEERNKANDRAAKAEEDAQARVQDLMERTRQLKSYKAKNTEIRTRYEAMENENKRLLRVIKDLQIKAHTSTHQRSDDEAPSGAFGQVLGASSSPSRPSSLAAGAKPSMKRTLMDADPDESLSVEMPSFDDSTRFRELSPLSPIKSDCGPSRTRQHPTARTYKFDTRVEPPLASRKKSKYFPTKHSMLASGLSGEITSDLTAVSETDDDDDEPRIIVPATSSPQRPSDVNRSRTNPFHTTRQETIAKTAAKLKRKNVETIEIGDSTDGDSPLRPSDTNVTTSSSSIHSNTGKDLVKKTSLNGKTPSMAMYLGLADRAGRPLKNVASGSKVKHRA